MKELLLEGVKNKASNPFCEENGVKHENTYYKVKHVDVFLFPVSSVTVVLHSIKPIDKTG